jgi:hypothetical protein
LLALHAEASVAFSGDEERALALVASTVLNLDETLTQH